MRIKFLFLIFLILLSLPAFSEETTDEIPEYEIGEGTPLSPEEIQRAQQNIQQLGQINSNITQLQTINTENFNKLNEAIALRLNSMQQSLVIINVVVVLAGIGLWYAIFLHLKSRKLL